MAAAGSRRLMDPAASRRTLSYNRAPDPTLLERQARQGGLSRSAGALAADRSTYVDTDRHIWGERSTVGAATLRTDRAPGLVPMPRAEMPRGVFLLIKVKNTIDIL